MKSAEEDINDAVAEQIRRERASRPVRATPWFWVILLALAIGVIFLGSVG